MLGPGTAEKAGQLHELTIVDKEIHMRAFADALIRFIPLHFAETRETYRVSALAASPKEAIRVAEKSLNSANPQLKAAAKDVIDHANAMLSGAPLEADENDIPASISSSSILTSASYQPVNDAEYESSWSTFEGLAVELFGPMGNRMARKIRTENPGFLPKDLVSKCEAVFGKDQAAAIFAKLKRAQAK